MDLKSSVIVRTAEVLGSAAGLLVDKAHIAARRPNALGTTQGFAPADKDGACWVKHHDGSLAAYRREELIPVD